MRLTLPPTVEVVTDWSHEAGIQLLIKRDDMIHPVVSGNKWRKLNSVIAACRSGRIKKVISQGGPYSNHIHALAFAGHTYGFNVEVYIRGYTLDTPTMRDVQQWGATCKLSGRAAYAQLKSCPPTTSASVMWLPEGGLSAEAVMAFNGISAEVPYEIDHWFVASGSGCTALGVWLDLPPSVELHEVPVYGLARQELLHPVHRLSDLGIKTEKVGLWQYHTEAVGTRFGKLSADQQAFINEWESETGVLLDPVYTGKLVWCVAKLCRQGYFKRGTSVLIHHTGGLQGRRR